MCEYCINALNSGQRWTQADGQTLHLTYTFNSLQGHFSDNGATSYALLNSAQRTAAEAALQQFENVANVTFDNTNARDASNTDMIFRVADLPGAAGWAFYPYEQHGGSDISFDHEYSQESILQPGQFGFRLFMHEIGHAMGLKHPHDGTDTLSAADDSQNATVMSYNSSTSSSTGGAIATRSGSTAPQTLQIYDIATLQYLYGANHDYNSDNDTYNLTGATSVSTLWDGNGTDTINSSGYTGNVTLDLREGLEYVTHVGSTAMWNAVGTNIENATAGSGNDTVYGNTLSNNLLGGSGNDFVFGNDGSDSINGNAGSDIVYGDEGADSVFGGRDADSVYGGNSSDLVNGNIGDDLVFGEAGDDVLHGGKDNDILYAGAGNDTLYGDLGSDILYGEAGNDVFVFMRPVGADTIMDFVHGSDKIKVSSDIFANVSDVLAATSITGSNSFINFGGSDNVTVVGITSLVESDFIIA